jgi:hypothetical protein
MCSHLSERIRINLKCIAYFPAPIFLGFFVAALPRPFAGADFLEVFEVEAAFVAFSESAMSFESEAGGPVEGPGVGVIADAADVQEGAF